MSALEAGTTAVPPTRTVLGRLVRRPLALFGLIVIAIVVVAAATAPWLAPYNPYEQFFDGLTLEGAPLPPDAKFWFGTDLVGRDVMSRLIYGAQTSLIIGVVANGIAVFIGSVVGICAGYFRGAVESILMRFTDLMMAFPALLLAIVLAAIFTPSLWIVVMVIAMVSSGVLSFAHSLAVVLGANIGTTIGSQIIALDIEQYIPALMMVGLLLMFVGKSNTRRKLGIIVLGFGLMFYGLEAIDEAMKPLRTNEAFIEAMRRLGETPLYGVLVGAVFTVVIQSSSATVAIVPCRNSSFSPEATRSPLMRLLG